MGATKDKVCLRVVEGLVIDRGDVFSPPFMFRVARPAFLLFLETPMKASFAIDILADIFVAIEAERRLCRFIESFMTGGARLFPLRMSLDDLPWHQRRFDSVGRSRCGWDEEGQRNSDNDVCDTHGL